MSVEEAKKELIRAEKSLQSACHQELPQRTSY